MKKLWSVYREAGELCAARSRRDDAIAYAFALDAQDAISLARTYLASLQ